MEPLITLTTDFGTRDPYVAAVKGVLLSGCPSARIVDLSHEIAAHDVLEGALFLASAIPYFPPGTVHLAVVDPGVGGARRAIVAAIADQLVVCPDNGLIGVIEHAHPAAAVHVIARHPDPRTTVSATFHARDLFAPVAARLAAGTWTIADVGPAIADPVGLDVPAPERRADGAIVATVIHVDRFGNAITNAGAAHVARGAHCVVRDSPLPVVRTYADVAVDAPCALIGSTGLIEVAVNQGSAAERFGIRRGDQVVIIPIETADPDGTGR
ncbi:MAG: SAM-dependent chlorinase/fluorinase [Chloroflexi bacterium]|nr:SAM-dependent chlorinase/fluorinase [Chloroflexota bacterium]MDA1003133.1 SAM-dependent chlorinase/fluorinase [Chloroflexota bacterium]